MSRHNTISRPFYQILLITFNDSPSDDEDEDLDLDLDRLDKDDNDELLLDLVLSFLAANAACLLVLVRPRFGVGLSDESDPSATAAAACGDRLMAPLLLADFLFLLDPVGSVVEIVTSAATTPEALAPYLLGDISEPSLTFNLPSLMVALELHTRLMIGELWYLNTEERGLYQ